MDVAICGYGVSIPLRRIAIEEIHNVWQNIPIQAVKRRGVKERAVIGSDEDTITLAADAAMRAVKMSGFKREDFGALLVGTQTSPYLTRPSASVLLEAIGLSNSAFAADVQFSAKSGTSALLLAIACVSSGMAKAALAIGADTYSFHVAPGDSQEYVASSGAGALVVAEGQGIATIERSASYCSDTPDWFRLDGERYIRTGGAAMTNTDVGMNDHVKGSWENLLSKTSYSPDMFTYLVIQQPDVRSSLQVARSLGFSKEQVTPGVISDSLGDCGSASPFISLARVLDNAKPSERIAMVSYGAGAGSDIFALTVTDQIRKADRKPTVKRLISEKLLVDYGTYSKLERKYFTHERKVSTFD